MITRALALIAACVALSLSACSKASIETPPEPAPAVSETTDKPAQDELVGRGEAIAEAACAGCHAVGAADESPHPDAPPLRLLSQTVDLDTLEAGFAESTVSDHPDMPDWQFEQIDAAGLIAYLKSVQSGSAD